MAPEPEPEPEPEPDRSSNKSVSSRKYLQQEANAIKNLTGATEGVT
jgi:hypothetical protein